MLIPEYTRGCMGGQIVKRKAWHWQARRGFTLYEILIYLAIFSVLSVLVVGLVVQVLTSGLRSARAREVVSSVTVAFDTLMHEAKSAREIYISTSNFGAANSQLSLETPLDPPSGEAFTFVDFYVDNGRLFMKRESESERALTGERIMVDHFRVMRLSPVPAAESVRIGISAHHRASRGDEDDSFAATTTVALRRNSL